LEGTVSLIQKRVEVRIVGQSDAIRRVEQKARMAAHVEANVLITGERGVGKAALGRFIHEHSSRSARGFAMLRCEGLPDLLVESELFGHAKGSFAGAYRDKPGLLKAASGGTLFLEEVGALSPRMQARLLRFVSTGEYMNIASDHVAMQADLDVRIIASTSISLQELVDSGLFLAELYSRLKVVSLAVPALRERRDDIPPLVDHFVGLFDQGIQQASDSRAASSPLTASERQALYRAEYPGNVRELRSEVFRQMLGHTA
jgi:DNA-binding NtrC family response regulator